jgi:acetyl-CoA acetyltransferase
MDEGRTIRGKAAVVGVGESDYTKHGRADEPEFKLLVRAVLRACDDAGISPKEIDGFCSYADDRNLPDRLSAALGVDELRLANMHWTSGGGGSVAPLANAAAAIAAGYADCVVAYRGLAQGQFGRFGKAQVPGGGRRPATVSGYTGVGQYFGGAVAPYGVMSAASLYALRATRMLEEHDVDPAVLEAVALASYHHARQNPRSIMGGKELDHDTYVGSRWIAEPFRLYDCCQETDGAAAVVLVSAERARALRPDAAYLLGAAQGGDRRSGGTVENVPSYGGNFGAAAARLYRQAGLKPGDVDVAQLYDNFTAGVVFAIVEHGFCSWEDASSFITFDNLVAPGGPLPLNTSGGNIGEAYIHGFNLVVEAVRQLRGESPNQVPGAKVCLAAGGPMTPVVSTALLGTEETLG